MHITEFSIKNYKSFLETQAVSLGRRLSIVIGQNDSGKSALIEAVSTRFSTMPHRSLATVPAPRARTQISSVIEIEVEFAEGEARELLSKFEHLVVIPRLKDDDDPSATLERSLLRSGRLRFFVQDGMIQTSRWSNHPTGTSTNILWRFTAQGPQVSPYNTGEPMEQYQDAMARLFRDRIYAFKAERLNVSASGIATSPELAPNAGNLAGVLHLLQSSNVSRFRRYCDAVHKIFPHVQQLTIPPMSENRAQILVWSIDPDSERADLAVPLSESGTGIGQVLAILYVTMTAETSRVILIDEPQSFLHPGAVRKLMGILQGYPQHQFIVSTHSPMFISEFQADETILVRRTQNGSIVERVDPQRNDEARGILSEVGARLSDVFGADSILWVEGMTEERCFPQLVHRLLGKPLQGKAILGVKQTGDFDGAHQRIAVDVYQKLSTGAGLLPPAVGFVFDPELRSPADRDALVRISKGRVHFLPRRMYENYLLNPSAIAAVCCGIDGFGPPEPSTEAVRDWIEAHRWDRKYHPTPKPQQSVELWEAVVDGATFLQDLFQDQSEQRVAFRKLEHSVQLTEWLIENSPADLKEVIDLLALILDAGEPVGSPATTD
jgi:hypothetical protein